MKADVRRAAFRSVIRPAIRSAASLAAIAASATAARAAAPEPFQLGFAPPVSPDAVEQIWFHNAVLLPVISAITVVVLALLVYVCWRFAAKRNPAPSKTTHHSMLEVVWTLVPVLILAALVYPSMRILYESNAAPDADLTIKVVGHQWYWEYQYPDHGDIGFDSFLAARTHEEAEAKGVIRLMDVDRPMVAPTGAEVRLLFTSADVIHNWAVSELGIRMDTVPGRLNEDTFMIPAGREGMYYGFCSELCGTDHAFMPIAVRAVSRATFDAWVASGGEADLDALASAAPARPAS